MGKSMLLRAITASLRKKFTDPDSSVAVTASTGLAARAIGGTTIHSWSGVQSTDMSTSKMKESIKRDKQAVARWKGTKVLIIDESALKSYKATETSFSQAFHPTVSMIDGEFFQKLSDVGCELRQNQSSLFGGIQVVMCGDFFQLPPIGSQMRFAFESRAWRTFIGSQNTVILRNVYRQEDPEFINALTELREGVISDSTDAFFRSLSTPIEERDLPSASEATHKNSLTVAGATSHRLDTFTYTMPALSLFPRRVDVGDENRRRLDEVNKPTFTYNCTEGGTDPQRWKRLLSSVAPEHLTIKKTAQVMLLKNIDAKNGLVNGSIGTVVGFYAPFELVSSDQNGYHISHIRHVMMSKNGKPIRRDELPLDKRPDNTQGSKACLDRLFKDDDRYPLVAFPLKQAASTEAVLLMRHRFRHVDSNGKLAAWREQVPLDVAYAISIHKSQGQTIDKLRVNLEGAFEKGQVYVALSRASRPYGLQVTGFQRSKVEAHPRVVEWYQHLKLEQEGLTPGVDEGDAPC
ncbi:hypothetical protein ONZ45_g14264 [Pleurotus djamor]|nr:hypothetical protein ONZ45_g14264 [Pleurotus djamor]